MQQAETVTIATTDVIFREDLYPRIEKSPVTVQKYADDLTVLPPIEINQHNELIDGWHRWTAYKKADQVEIPVTITVTNSDAQLLELAIERNSTHGLQLSQEDKKNMARAIYHSTPEKEREEKKKYLGRILSVSERTVRDWLSRIDKDSRAARDKRIFDLWMACHTQEEIGERENVDQKTISNILGEKADLPKLLKSDQAAATHAVDFDPPLYNIWKQQDKTKGSSHFGNSEVRWLDNLLYMFTEPFETVVDLFAGGGSTIDLCKKRFRRYWVSDRLPIVERESEIRKWDICDGLPKIPRWNEVGLVYLDPPYWKQAEGKYSSDPTDLGNMSLVDFNARLSSLIKDITKKLRKGSRIALIIQPTQWNAPDKQYTDHIIDMTNRVDIPVELRISCPYESQQYTPQMVNYAKENKIVLVLTREIIVWRV